jgi:hypothetical protein
VLEEDLEEAELGEDMHGFYERTPRELARRLRKLEKYVSS